jgi:hypothetical protein
MKRIALILAALGLLTVGTASAWGQEVIVNPTPGPIVTSVPDQPVVLPVRRFVYYGGPGWSAYPYAGSYYAYRPVYPYRYYYPGYRYYATPGFSYWGPRVRIGVGF